MGKAKKKTGIPRSLTVHFTGSEVAEGKVSINLFIKALSAFQQALYDIGDYKLQRKASVRGRKPEMLRKEAELFLSQTEKGSYAATLELRKKGDSLFPELRDTAEFMLHDLKEVLMGVGNQEPKRIKAVIPSEQHRSKLMRDLLKVTPPPKANYAIAVRFGKQKTEYRLARPAEEFLHKVGGNALVAAAKEEFQEAIVHARCSIRYDSEGNIKQIDSISPEQIIECTLFDELDAASFEPKAIETKDGKFILNRVPKCKVQRDNEGLIIIECKELGIRSYADTRQKAEELFGAEFTYIWQEYAEADDHELSEDALDLKKILKKLVKQKG